MPRKAGRWSKKPKILPKRVGKMQKEAVKMLEKEGEIHKGEMPKEPGEMSKEARESSNHASEMPSSSGGRSAKKQTPFGWTLNLDALLLGSFIMEDGTVMFPRANDGFLRPLKMFTCYTFFCKQAFNGNPPPECSFEEYEKRFNEIIPFKILP